MKVLTLLSKDDCELCISAKNILEKLKSQIPFVLEVKNIANDNLLLDKYKFKIPVILIDGVEKFHSKISEKLIIEELK